MMCRKPYITTGAAYGCGQCMPCRVNRRRLWTHRIMLEAAGVKDKCFVTLTYDDKHLPTKNGVGVLMPSELQLWLKKFRRRIEPLKVRFYAVGEYGTVRERPHYHIMLFGWNGCLRGLTKTRPNDAESWKSCCENCRLVGETWGFGAIFIGGVTKASAGYVAGYTVKKMTSPDDKRLKGRPPEFCRMSLRPGIGANQMWDVASSMLAHNVLDTAVDVPQALNYGKSPMPLGRYLRKKLRTYVGRDEKAPVEVLEKASVELSVLREEWWAERKEGKFSDWLTNQSAGDVASQEARLKLFKKREVL